MLMIKQIEDVSVTYARRHVHIPTCHPQWFKSTIDIVCVCVSNEGHDIRDQLLCIIGTYL